MMKKVTAILTAILLLSTFVTGCGKPAEPTVPETTQATEMPTETPAEMPTEEPTEGTQRPKNELVFAGGGMFTGLKNIVSEFHEDGTYRYEDLTEDGMTSIVNLCVPRTVPICYTDEFITDVVNTYGGEDVKNLEICGAGEQESIKSEMLTTYVYWTTGSNEDTRQCHGVIVEGEHYTYFYYLSIGIDFFDEMDDTFIDALDRVQLEPMA